MYNLLTASPTIEQAFALLGQYDPHTSVRTQLVGDGADCDLALEPSGGLWNGQTEYTIDTEFGMVEIINVQHNLITPYGPMDLLECYDPETGQTYYAWAEYKGMAVQTDDFNWVIGSRPETG